MFGGVFGCFGMFLDVLGHVSTCCCVWYILEVFWECFGTFWDILGRIRTSRVFFLGGGDFWSQNLPKFAKIYQKYSKLAKVAKRRKK